MDAADSDALYSDVKAAKKLLFQSLQGTDGLQYLDEERVKIKKSFDHAFVHKLSTSLILVGRSSNECIMLVRSVLNSYTSDSFVVSSTSQRHSKIKNYTARVSGASQLSDHEALIDMANQFLLRNEKEANVNMALEDLEDHFKQCRLDGIPAIIVLEDFHAFAKRNRQTLIYTLLDLMHNKSLLFTVSTCSILFFLCCDFTPFNYIFSCRLLASRTEPTWTPRWRSACSPASTHSTSSCPASVVNPSVSSCITSCFCRRLTSHLQTLLVS